MIDPVASPAMLAVDRFQADLRALGATSVRADGADVLRATFPSDNQAALATALLRGSIQTTPGDANTAVRLLLTPVQLGVPTVGPSGDQLAAGIGHLPGVTSAQHLDSLNMFSVVTSDRPTADRLTQLLRPQLIQTPVVIDVDAQPTTMV